MTGERRLVADDSPPTPDPAIERALVDRARAGDQQAVGAVYDLYVDRVFRFVVGKVGNPTDAEDLTAEILIRVIEHLPRFQWQGAPFISWVMQIARNHVTSHYRRSSTRANRTSIDEMEIEDTKAGPESLVEHKATMAEVRAAVAKLPEAQRQVIALRFFAGLSVRETAQMLNKSENNVKVLQFKAIARLQKLLGEQPPKDR